MTPDLTKKPQIAVIGAGIAGLTLSYELAKSGCKVFLIEKQKEVGGLARTFRYGDFKFDIGPHRFHTEKPQVNDFIQEILGSEALTIDRHSSVFLFGKYHQWPLRPKSLIRLPKKFLFSCLFDLFFKPKNPNPKNFEEFIISKYGKTIFELFFHDYTEKYCHAVPKELHSRWASISIDRAIIDKKLKMDSLFDTLKIALLPKPVTTKFTYPRDGIYIFSEILKEKIKNFDGEVYTEVDNLDLKLEQDQIKGISFKNQNIPVDFIVWTAPLTEICSKLNILKPKIRYLHLIIYNIELDFHIDIKDQWIYFPAKDYLLSRASFPQNFSPYMNPEGKSGIVVELTSNNDELWHHPDLAKERIMQDLEKVNLCKPKQILNIHIEKIPFAYPVYELHYEEEVGKAKNALAKYKNLELAGRTALFWYNNMDDSIENAFEIAQNIKTKIKI